MNRSVQVAYLSQDFIESDRSAQRHLNSSVAVSVSARSTLIGSQNDDPLPIVVRRKSHLLL